MHSSSNPSPSKRKATVNAISCRTAPFLLRLVTRSADATGLNKFSARFGNRRAIGAWANRVARVQESYQLDSR